jgi:excisionase family DNA binding protein
MAATNTLVPVEKLYTKAEAAQQLNVPLRFVERCVFQRRVRVIRLGRHIRIPESALAELLTLGTTPAQHLR